MAQKNYLLRYLICRNEKDFSRNPIANGSTEKAKPCVSSMLNGDLNPGLRSYKLVDWGHLQ